MARQPRDPVSSTSASGFGATLRRYRELAGLSQEQLAERAGLSEKAIGALERGERRRPYPRTLDLLATVLGLHGEERRALIAAALGDSGKKPTVGSRARPSPDPASHPSEWFPPKHNLPTPLTSFVGREREVAGLKERLLTTRLLTLTGAGGCGKTRLALHVAAKVVEQYPDGVWLVELASLADPALVPQAVARVLEIRELPEQPLLVALGEALGYRDLLLVLDNCEHVLDACAGLADALLQRCPTLRVLATSREPLGIQGETTWRVPSLAVPEVASERAPEQVREYEAVRLFIERAQAVAPDFAVTPENAAALAQVCCRLDGIPLAIELAAARVRVLTVAQIAGRLDDRFRLLTGGSRTALRRQQTLRGLIDWSHDLLTAEERTLFRRLAVFAGSWTLEAAESVGVGDGIEAEVVLDLLTSLVDKSLVVVEPTGGEQRYRFLETVRAYAGEKLAEASEAQRLRDRHAAWCLVLAERAEPELYGPASRVWLDRLEADNPNLRAALEWLLETDPDRAARLGGSLWKFWYLYPLAEGVRWLEAVLARAPVGSATRGKVLLGAGFLARAWGVRSHERAWTEASLAIAQETGDRDLAAWALHNLGCTALSEGDRATARVHLEESVSLGRQVGDKVIEAISLRDLGHVTRSQGDLERAAGFMGESLALVRQIGHPWNIIYTLSAIGVLAREQQDRGRAREAFQECLALSRESRDPHMGATAAYYLGALELAVGNLDLAEILLKMAVAEMKRWGWHGWAVQWIYPTAALFLRRGSYGKGVRLAAFVANVPSRLAYPSDDVAVHDAALRDARAALGDTAFASAWQEGQAMTLGEAMTDALEGDEG
jgi:non-specific serine/threonine protein kinase